MKVLTAPDPQFASDNYSGAHPAILQAFIDAAQGSELSYGNDNYTKQAEELFSKIFQRDCAVFFVTTGTASNVIALASVMTQFQAVVCTDVAHINTDECGAFERFVGGKLLSVPAADGKLEVADIAKYVSQLGDVHRVQPAVVSITQATEFGTVYSIDEIRAITTFAHSKGLLVHMDGARLTNAAVSLGCSLAGMTSLSGVDILSFGGTKNGMVMGEAIVFFDKELAKNVPFVRKQGMQLCSKMRFISAQFLAFFNDDLYLQLAQNANNMAQLLAQQAAQISGIELLYPVQANEIFVKIKKVHRDRVLQAFFFYTWSEEADSEWCVVRWVTSFKTTKEDVEQLVAALRIV